MTTANDTRRTDWIAYGHFGVTHYRIWQRMTEHGMFQRHEWVHEKGGVTVDPWIPSTSEFAPGMKPAR